MRRTTTRRRVTALGAVIATAASMLATLAITASPASAGINPNTKYEIDCTTTLGASTAVSPFIVTANLNAAPDPRFPTGATFGASGALSFTIQGPQLAAFAGNGILVGGQIGMNIAGLKISSTDGTATGTYNYSANLPAQAPSTHNVGAVSWTVGNAVLSGGSFLPTDVGGGLTGAGLANGTTIINVTGGVATVNPAPTGSGSSGSLNVYLATTYTDASVSTGSVFTTSGSVGGQARVGVTGLTGGFSFPGNLTVTFGTAGGGAGTNNCMQTGWQGATPGPAQTGDNPSGPWPPYAGAPVFPSVVTTPLVAATGGFVSQPGTSQQITPPAAAFVTLADTPPTASNADYNLGTGQSSVVTLPVSDTDATPPTGCNLVGGSISDPRLSVTVSNSPTICQATLTDSGSTPATVTFQFTGSDSAGTGAPATATVHIGTAPVDERLGQNVIGGQLVLSCTSPDVYTVGGSPALTCPDFNFAAVTLNGLQQTRTGAGSTLYVSDNRGNPAAGWTLTAFMIPTATNPNASCAGIVAFCNASVGSHALDTSLNGQIAPSNLAISAIGCAPHAGNLNVAATAGAGGTFALTQTVCTAAAQHSGGTFDVTKTYTLTIPSSVYAGQYWGTVEYLVQ